MPTAEKLPGLNVGPLDPDKTADFGTVSAKTSARALLRQHAEAHSPALTGVLARPLNEPRSKALDLDEVRDLLDGQLPEGSKVVGAQVRGAEEVDKFLTFTYVVPSGRSVKGFVPYDTDGLEDSHERGDLAAQVQDLKEAGLPFGDAMHAVAAQQGGGSSKADDRKAKKLQEQLDEANALIERLNASIAAVGQPTHADIQPPDGGEKEPQAEVVEGAGDPSPQIASDTVPEGQPAEPDPAAQTGEGYAATEPIKGYDDKTAAEIAQIVQDDETSVETVKAIHAYELSHDRRATVIKAAERHGASRE